MATPFINATFLNLTRERGLCHYIAYLGRTIVDDERLDQTLDLTNLPPDLAYSEIRLPHNAPAAFEDGQVLANAADQADARHMRKTADRKRWPQLAAALIAALPPDNELTLDEALELIERIVDRIIGDRSLVAVIAVHDPRLITSGARNRHCHILIVLREVDRAGFGKKVRDLFARARFGSGGRYYVAEGEDWPARSAEMQQTLFLELATDTVVDPPAPIPDERWPEATMRNDPMRVAKHRRAIRHKNIEFIYGPAEALVDRMLRGRGAVLVQELRQLLARFLDGEPERRDRLDEILTDAAIVTLTAHAGDPRPSRLTTRRVYEMMTSATQLVDRATGNSQTTDGTTAAPRLAVVSRPTAAAVDRAIVTQVGVEAPLLVGTHSDCAPLKKELAPLRPTLISVAALLHSMDGGACGAIPHAGLIVVPCSNTVPDQALAAIITAVEAQGSRLLLGYNEGAGTGIAAHRLAAYAADLMAPSQPDDHHWIERLLRAGLVDRAVATLHERGMLRFAAADGPELVSTADFVVCDDNRRIDAVNKRISSVRAAADHAEAGFEFSLPGRSLQLWLGQWITVTGTDYTVLPPVLRAGQLGQIIELSPGEQTIRVQLANGSTAAIDLARHPHVRPAFAISIREARRAPPISTLLIEMTQRKYSWAAMLLAASRADGRAIVRVDPAVARDIAELARVVRASLPAALPAELTPQRDPDVTLQPILGISQAAPETDVTEQAPIDFDEWIEYLPEPEAPQVASPPEAGTRASPLATISSRAAVSAAIPADLHADLRKILARADCEEALQQLKAALAPENPDRQVIADELRALCQADNPTAVLIETLMRPEDQAPHDPLAELDLPHALAEQAPRAWTPWDLHKFRVDLLTMPCKWSVWQRAFNHSSSLDADAELSGRQGPPTSH
jgi:hypothetical protein